VTLRSIISGAAPILYVSHDLEDDGWQFLDGRTFDRADAALVGLGEIVRRDPSVSELADMPPGWVATRETKQSPWRRNEGGGSGRSVLMEKLRIRLQRPIPGIDHLKAVEPERFADAHHWWDDAAAVLGVDCVNDFYVYECEYGKGTGPWHPACKG
jgi:hypothetical protein